MQMALDSLLWAGLTSVDSVLFAKSASVPSDHTHFFSTETCVFDRQPMEKWRSANSHSARNRERFTSGPRVS
jgi:hypothetical protein